MSGMERASEPRGLLRPGKTCWRIARADRMSVIVDAADYFRHLRSALRKAERTIYLIGWDFDLRLEMLPGETDEDGNAPDGLPNTLGDFLQRVVSDAPDVSLRILKWDKAMLMEIAQQAVQTLELKLSDDDIHFALDSHHPTGATHHMKVSVIDDRMAFCGGIDVTGYRWDTREHAPDDPRRTLPGGDPHGPWHDVTTALSGPVARALGDLGRERWQDANGEELEPPEAGTDPWPDDLEVDLEGVEIGIARTKPDYKEQDEVDEIEQLYLAAIYAAERTIYIENQYFAAGSICRALEERMAEPDGPELVVIGPKKAQTIPERVAMDTARARMIERVKAAAVAGGGGPDGRRRFRFWHPVNAAGTPIYVHAKVLIVDDRLVRIGSSNVNNRSIGFDTECDVAFEARTPEQTAFAVGLRHDLLAEHLGSEPDAVARAVADAGSLIGGIEALNGKAERRLCPVDPGELNALQRELGDRLLEDERVHPRNRPRPVRAVTHAAKRAMAPYHFETVGVGAALLAAGVVGLGVWAGMRYARHRARTRRPFPAPAVIGRARRAPVAVRDPEEGRVAVAVVPPPVPPRRR